jgi:hypothetical protein
LEEYNYSGRFFAFGCSFTINNTRPTWADIVGQQFAEYQNWGRGGSGNQYIFNSLIECNQRNKFTADDTVMIMWSSTTREDRYVAMQQGWIGNGNIYYQDIYSQDFVKQLSCERGYLLRDLASVSAATDLLKAWGVKYKQFTMLPFDIAEIQGRIRDTSNADILNLYQPIIDQLVPSVYEVVFNSEDWQKKKSDFGAWIDDNCTIRDSHPDPAEALDYVRAVLPEINIKQETLDWLHNFKYGTEIPYIPLDRF